MHVHDRNAVGVASVVRLWLRRSLAKRVVLPIALRTRRDALEFTLEEAASREKFFTAIKKIPAQETRLHG